MPGLRSPISLIRAETRLPQRCIEQARIILAQPDLVGYFGSGSGVASQEQFWSAYGLAKAFWELDLDIPAVIRLGGNTEDRAVEILRRMSKLLRAPVEGYRKTDTPAFIAARFAELVAERRWEKMETAISTNAKICEPAHRRSDCRGS